MNNTDFTELVEKRLQAIRDTLISKGKEYSSEEDRLINFKLGAKKSGLTSIQVLQGYKLKHEISIDEICRDFDGGKVVYLPQIDEKFTDDICYRILQEAILKEK